MTFVEVEGQKATAAQLNRDITTASQRAALRSSVSKSYSALADDSVARSETPAQRNRKS